MTADGDVPSFELIGDYAVLRGIARGGNAAVYACRGQSLGRDVAVKVLHRLLLREHCYGAGGAHEQALG